MRKRVKDRGAAAVELALVLPLLLALLFGIFEFGRLFYTQIALSNAAREGARVMAIVDNVGLAQDAAIAVPGLEPILTPGQVAIVPASCEDNPGMPVTVTITYEMSLIVPGFWEWATGDELALQGSGQMICGG